MLAMIHWLNDRGDRTLCGKPFVYGECSSDPNNVTCPKCSKKLDAILPPPDSSHDHDDPSLSDGR